MAADSIEQRTLAPPEAATPPHPWLEVLLIFAVFYVAGGAPAPHINESYYLTKAKHYWQPDWCPGDDYLDSADAHLVFYWTVGWLAKFISLPTVAWIGRVIAWLLLAWSWQRLSSRVTPGPYRSVLSAMLLYALIDQANFAGEWLIGGVESKCFAYASVFLALAYLAEGRWRPVWPLLGIASAFHVLVGGWSVIAAALVWLVQPRSERPSLVSMLPALVLGGLLSLPGVWPALQLTAHARPEVRGEAARIYVFDRLPHHLAPLTMPWDDLIVRAGPFAALVLVWGALWLWQTVLVRQSDLPEEERQTARRLRRLQWFALFAVAIAAAGLVWELIAWNYPVHAARVLKYYLFRLADIAVPLATSLLVLWLADLLLSRRSRLGIVLLLVAALLPGWLLVKQSSDRWFNQCPPADRKMRSCYAWREACEWVRANTPEDALFLVPRLSQSFQWYAHRADVVTWKNVPQDAANLLTWRDRYNDIYRHLDKDGLLVPFRSLAGQGTLRVRELAETYGADYLVTSEYPPLQIPPVYVNQHYAVYPLSERAKQFSPTKPPQEPSR